MKKEIIKISDLTLDKSIYPRKTTSWYNVNSYAEAMRTGAEFPPIVVAKFENKKYLVDGWHRVGAYNMNKVEFVQAETWKPKNENEIFIEAVKRNSVHGRQFSFQEKLMIVDKLQKMKVSKDLVSEITGLTPEKMKKYTISRLARITTGEPVILKSTFKHLAGSELTDDEIELQESIPVYSSQELMLNNMVSMLENQLFDWNDPEILTKLDRIRYLIGKLLRGIRTEAT